MMQAWTILKKHLRDLFEASVILSYLATMWLLPVKYASYLSGWVGRNLLKRVAGGYNRAQHNFELTMPNLTASERETMSDAVFDNIGRNYGELPHLHTMAHPRHKMRVQIRQQERVRAMLTAHPVVIFASGHFSNYHIPILALRELSCPVAVIYRQFPNLYVGAVSRHLFYGDLFERHLLREAQVIHSGIKALREGISVSTLCDQRGSSNINVTFFGYDIEVPFGTALMALRCHVPIIPLASWRVGHGLDRAHFVVDFGEAILPPAHGGGEGFNHKAAMGDMMQQVFGYLESTIREHPTDWLWTYDLWRDVPRRVS